MNEALKLCENTLVQSNDVGQKRKRFDLRTHKVHKNLTIKHLVATMLITWLKSYGFHDQWNEFRDLLMNVLFVQLIHQNHNYRQFL